MPSPPLLLRVLLPVVAAASLVPAGCELLPAGGLLLWLRAGWMPVWPVPAR
jgi:hypothetical protein